MEQPQMLLFGGTTEGRELAEALAAEGWAVTLCVATEYGAALAPDCPGVTVHTGRLDQREMEALMKERHFRCVADATHPYAVEVTEHIQNAAECVGLPYHRILRENDQEDGCQSVRSLTEAAELLRTLPGSVLLTTGSKELEPFAVPGLVERCFPRVLPTVEAVKKCRALGFSPKHIIAMQGPFSQELNVALLHQFGIRTLVTKASGSYGGFREKAEAARLAGCHLVVVERPRQEEGVTPSVFLEQRRRERHER